MPEPHLKLVYVPPPVKRRLRAFAFDPSLGRQLESAGMNQVTIQVPWEKLRPGPVGEYLEVVDIDPASGVFYPPVDLERKDLLAQDGLSPSEESPQFHQQMVYAVAMATIARFEKALGRRVFWSRPVYSGDGRELREYVPRLFIYPHALRGDNAYFDKNRQALLFGYFQGSGEESADVLDGGTIFTCLSHDIIAHETTHALLHSTRELFGHHPANRDMRAFHEAFADLVVLFQRFTYPEIIKQQIARTRGDLVTSENLLGQIAQQFGKALGKGHALRDAIGEVDLQTHVWRRKRPEPKDYATVKEDHDRGQILVRAVFDAFLAIYQSRSTDLLRIATGGTGKLPPGEIHPDLVDRLAKEVTNSADHILNICIRALDYLPPVDATFGDYLRAIITADYDMVGEDRYQYRTAFLEAFWRHGIQLRNVRSLSVESLLWRPPDQASAQAIRKILGGSRKVRSFAPPGLMERKRQEVFNTVQANSQRLLSSIYRYPDQGIVAHALQEMWVSYGPDALPSINRGARQLPILSIPSILPTLRITLEGTILNDLLIMIIQTRRGYYDPQVQDQVDKKLMPPPPHDFILYGGCTMIVDRDSGEVRYAIGKRVDSDQRLNEAREMAQRGPF